MNVIVLGDRSDIFKAMQPSMATDGWEIHGWHRTQDLPAVRWDLCLVPMGQVFPVGFWAYEDHIAWSSATVSNVLEPVRLLRCLWPMHNPNAKVCFFAGANPNKPMENYSAYSVGKMALLKACEHLDLESKDCIFFALAPGVVLTKIHRATDDAGVHNPRLEQARRDGGVPISRIYSCLKWCLRQSKDVVGGRNICVSDSKDWDAENELQRMLKSDPNIFKLRRMEWD